MRLPCVRLTLSLAESMAIIGILGIGLALPSEISIPVGILSVLWLISASLPPRGAKAGMIVLMVFAVVLLIGLLWETLFPVRLVSVRGPTTRPMMSAWPEA
jgi:hypothetical protein